VEQRGHPGSGGGPSDLYGAGSEKPQSLRYRFLRTYTALSEELHQTGYSTKICTGADYWHLLLRYVEREMKEGPLHIYKSPFSCGFILQGCGAAVCQWLP